MEQISSSIHRSSKIFKTTCSQRFTWFNRILARLAKEKADLTIHEYLNHNINSAFHQTNSKGYLYVYNVFTLSIKKYRIAIWNERVTDLVLKIDLRMLKSIK